MARNWDRVRVEDRGRRNGWEQMEPLPSKNKKKQKKTPPMPGCPLCTPPMVQRSGKFGAFWSCARFPACRGSARLKSPR